MAVNSTNPTLNFSAVEQAGLDPPTAYQAQPARNKMIITLNAYESVLSKFTDCHASRGVSGKVLTTRDGKEVKGCIMRYLKKYYSIIKTKKFTQAIYTHS